MEQGYINQDELRDFVFKHKLMDKHSNIQFRALVSIKTDNNELLNEEMNVMITLDGFDSYGKVFLLGDNLDFTKFPIVFEAKWQKMEHVNNIFLKISDIHKKNLKIGKYCIKIVPMKMKQEYFNYSSN